jgi:hypothetical protein
MSRNAKEDLALQIRLMVTGGTGVAIERVGCEIEGDLLHIFLRPPVTPEEKGA